MHDVETVVIGVITARLSRADAADLLAPDADLDGIRTRLTELRDRRDGLAAMLSDGLLSESAVREQAVRLGEQIDVLQREQREATGADPLAAVIATEDVAATLESLGIRTLRAVINAVMVVRILLVRKGVRFAPRHVDIEWMR